MIGLIKKDFYLNMKMIRLTLIYYIGLLIFGHVFRYSYIYGNLKNTGSNGNFADNIFIVLLGGVTAAIISSIPTSCIEKDRNSGFNAFMYTTTVLEKKIITAKILEVLICTGISMLSLMFSAVIFGVQFGFSHIKTGIVIGIIFILLLGFVGTIAIPVTILVKKCDTAIAIIIVGAFICIVGLCVILYMTKNKFMDIIFTFLQGGGVGDFNWSYYGFVIILISIALYIVGIVIAYFTSIKALSRREKVCGV